MLSDIEIANAADAAPDHRGGAGRRWGSTSEHLVPYGHDKAKVDLGYLHSLADRPLGQADPDDRAVADPGRRGQDHHHGRA